MAVKNTEPVPEGPYPSRRGREVKGERREAAQTAASGGSKGGNTSSVDADTNASGNTLANAIAVAGAGKQDQITRMLLPPAAV